MQLTIDETSGLPTKMTIPGVSESASFQQNFFFYSSYAGNNEIYQNQSSGAYVFRPNSSLLSISSQATIKIYKGTILAVSPLLGNRFLRQVSFSKTVVESSWSVHRFSNSLKTSFVDSTERFVRICTWVYRNSRTKILNSVLSVKTTKHHITMSLWGIWLSDWQYVLKMQINNSVLKDTELLLNTFLQFSIHVCHQSWYK